MEGPGWRFAIVQTRLAGFNRSHDVRLHDQALGLDQFAIVTSSYQFSSDKRLLFGLGTADSIPEIEIRWPSGIRQVLHDQKPDRFITITEPLK